MLVIAGFALSSYSFAQVYTFTNAGAIGNVGPTQAQLNTAYTGTPLAGQVTSNSGIQRWIVPTTGTYRVETWGAQGSNATATTGGLGAYMSGEFALTAGETLWVLVGQNAPNTPNRINLSSSGGGGTFVTKAPHNTNASILVIAGGGGGTGNERPATSNATTAQNGQTGSAGAGGVNGNGGTTGTAGAGPGGGFFTNGINTGFGFAYVNGGAGGPVNATYSVNGGGFGGGGSVTSGGNSRYGGGGGYSGGSGSTSLSGATTGLWGGGGGSYNNGTNQLNQGGVNTGHGKVVITFPAPTCLSPILLEATSITGTSASLDWFEPNSATLWQIQHGSTGFTLGTGTLASNVTTKPYSLTGLTALTTYDYYVRSICGPGDTSNWAGPFTFTTACAISLSGTYTLNSTLPTGGTNFNSFSDLDFQLNTCGISGPVVVNVATGTYNDRMTLGAISGSSATNTVTIRSATGDSTNVVLQYSTTAADEWTIRFTGTEYVTFEKMTIRSTGASNGRTFLFNGGANHIVVQNCRIETNTTSTSSTFSAIHSASGNINNYVRFSNNVIVGGYYGIYWWGTSTIVKNQSTIIEKNDFVNPYYYGTYVYYNDSLQFRENNVSNRSNSNIFYGLASYYSDNGSRFLKNIITTTNTGTSYPMLIGTSNGGALRTLVANNFISQQNSTGTVYPLYLTGPNNVDVYYNSVHMTGGSATAGRAFFQTGGSNINVVNNIFSNTGGGFASYVNTPTAISTMNHNNYYATGTTLAFWGSNALDLAALQQLNSQDANSVSIDPLFVSNTDLHTNQSGLGGLATPFAPITDDIDGDIRNLTNPCIGADEFPLTMDDAGIAAIDTPFLPSCVLDTNVWVTLNNFGVNTLTNCSINWSVNGVLQTPVSFTGTVAPFTGTSASTFIGTYNFQSGDVLRVWTSLPNGQPDVSNTNDTIEIILLPAMDGIYTINPSGTGNRNFVDFTTAYNALAIAGVCGNVIFDVASGTYNEQLSMFNIQGVSSTSTVTFRSASGDSTDVVLQYASTSALDNYVVQFSAIEYIRFERMTIRNTGASFGRVLDFNGGANYIKIENCRLETNTTATGSNYACVFSNSGNINDYVEFRNNEMIGGYYGVYWWGTSTTVLSYGTVFENNIINDFWYYGIYLYYTDSTQVHGNRLTNRTGSGIIYGITSYFGQNGCSYTKNEVILSNTSTFYGILIGSSNGSTSNRILVANNFISQTQVNTATVYALYLATASNIDIIHNSVQVVGGSATGGRAFFQSGGSSINVTNNIFSNIGGGYASYVGTPTGISTMDYNNYYSTGATLAYWNTNQANLTALQTANSQDANSLSLDPLFVSNTDLHIEETALCGVASYTALVVDDIDGHMRKPVGPCMGADELLTDDAGIAIINSPDVPGCLNNDVIVTLENQGIDTLTYVEVMWSVNGALQTQFTWTGVILPNGGQSVPLSIGNFAFNMGDTLVVWTTNPNNAIDYNPRNDTMMFIVPQHDLASLPSTLTICNNGSGMLDPQINAVFYAWSTGDSSNTLTVTVPGVYSITVVDSVGCESTAETTVSEAALVSFPDTTKFCEGGAATLETNMQGTYFWNTGSTASTLIVSQSGLYSVTVVDIFGCTSDASTEVVEVLLPVASYTFNSIGYGTIFTNTSQNGTSYFWDFGDGDTSTEENPHHLYLWPGGTFAVTLYVTNECGTDSITFEVEAGRDVSVNEIVSLENSKVYPNPNRGTFTVELNASKTTEVQIEIYDLVGKIVYQQKLGQVSGNTYHEINAEIPSGIYMLRVSNKENHKVHRVSIQR